MSLEIWFILLIVKVVNIVPLVCQGPFISLESIYAYIWGYFGPFRAFRL